MALQPALWALLAYAVMSTVCFVMYARDKAAARRGGRRVPESTLLTLGLLCGWPGGLVAQQRLRHKTIKQPFRAAFWASVVVNLAVLGLLLVPEARAALWELALRFATTLQR